jgi:hypothetical protein
MRWRHGENRPIALASRVVLECCRLDLSSCQKKVVSQTDPTQRYANLGASTIPHKPKHLSLLQGQKSETRQPQYCTTENDAALLLIATID